MDVLIVVSKAFRGRGRGRGRKRGEMLDHAVKEQ